MILFEQVGGTELGKSGLPLGVKVSAEKIGDETPKIQQ